MTLSGVHAHNAEGETAKQVKLIYSLVFLSIEQRSFVYHVALAVQDDCIFKAYMISSL